MPTQREVQQQLTIDFITKRRLNAPAIWLSPESASPVLADAERPPDGLNTDLDFWGDDRNLGVRLVDGFIELQITAPDDIWVRELFNAGRSLGLDMRASFGPSRGPVRSILFKCEDPSKIDKWTNRWPKGHKDNAGVWVETKFIYSLEATARSKAIWRNSTPLPGSRFGGNLIIWRPWGKPAAEDVECGLDDLEIRPIASTTMESIIRAIAFATLSYWIKIYLDGLNTWEGSLVRVIGGWIARLVREGRDINARGKSIEGICWSPIDSVETAGDLIRFLDNKELGNAFLHAEAELERGRPVAGWSAIETLFGPQAKVGIRRAFRAGLDIDIIEQMSDQYIYDQAEDLYLDRDSLFKGLPYKRKADHLIATHDNESIIVGKKALNPFRIYMQSSLRTDVNHHEFRPGYEPGAILRFSPVHGILNGEAYPDEYRILNTFPGFHIKPIATIDPELMRIAITMLDRMLGLLTRDNDDQILWLKKFIAQIAQHPEIKPQVVPIIVGGQGIGKSLFGDNLMRALFGNMSGTADAGTLSDNKFMITPFINKLITFIDEVKLESAGSINIIKKLVRSDYVSGQVKFGHQRDYYIPSRMLIASNSPDIGLSPADAADRAFFFIVAWTAQNKGMNDHEFLEWAGGLKSFYSEFVTYLSQVPFKRHLMRYFMDLPVEREDLEDLEFSSRSDESVVKSTMSKERQVARDIVADARIVRDIRSWFNISNLREAVKRVDDSRDRCEAGQVLREFDRAGVIEPQDGGWYKFKWGYATLLEKLGEVHGLKIHNMWPFQPGDWGENDVASIYGGPDWRGNKKQKERPTYDPDSMDDR